MNASHTALSTSLLALSATLHAQRLVRSVNGPAALARLGATSIFVPDQNGDGVRDVLVGAPGFNSSRGAIYCVSGAYLMTGTGASTLWSLAPKANAGDAVRAVADLNGDGVGEYMVGAPDFFRASFLSGWRLRGLVRIYSGATGVQLTSIAGGSTDRLGDGPGCSIGDLNGDALREFVVTG